MRFGHQLRRGLPLLVIVCSASPLWATVYNETSGDLSGNQAAPTPLALTSGTNSVIGSVGGGDFQDWISFTVPSGFQMNSYTHSAYAGADAQGFTGFQPGAAFVGSAGTAGSYAGYAHFGTGATNGSGANGVNGGAATTTVNVDLFSPNYMPNNSAGGCAAGATGFTVPLPAGTYTFLIQQSGGAVTYQFDANVAAAVPEPASLALLAAAALLLPRRRRN